MSNQLLLSIQCARNFLVVVKHLELFNINVFLELLLQIVGPWANHVHFIALGNHEDANVTLLLCVWLGAGKDAPENTILLQVYVLYIVLNLVCLFIRVAPLLTLQAMHVQFQLVLRLSVKLEEQTLERVFRCLEPSNQIQGITLIQIGN